MRQARVEQGLTLRAVAEAAGVSPGTVKKIEVGRLVPSIEIFLKVVKALRRRVSYFFAEDDEKYDLRLIRRGSGPHAFMEKRKPRYRRKLTQTLLGRKSRARSRGTGAVFY
jgi:transcriptional regulator with XRE-family HTH domain